jgi:hypothetical protein
MATVKAPPQRTEAVFSVNIKVESWGMEGGHVYTSEVPSRNAERLENGKYQS